MSYTLEHMHKKKENVGVLGRLHMWHLQSFIEFKPPQSSKIVSDIASIDHLVLIAHEIFQSNPEFRFKKHSTDIAQDSYISKIIEIHLALNICQYFFLFHHNRYKRFIHGTASSKTGTFER